VSVRVALEALAEEITRFGPVVFLVTATPGTRPHVASVHVTADAGRLRVPAGRTSRANATMAPDVTLCWPGPPAGDHALLVDATAVVDEATECLILTPTGAVLHRRADGPR
jgi:hypothetical protein